MAKNISCEQIALFVGDKNTAYGLRDSNKQTTRAWVRQGAAEVSREQPNEAEADGGIELHRNGIRVGCYVD